MITRGAAIVTLLVVLWGPAVLGEHLVAVHYEQEHKEQASYPSSICVTQQP
jgi:hypothetical protein